MDLTTSYWPAHDGHALIDMSVGDALRVAAGRYGEASALLEVTEAGDVGRSWSFSALLADAETLAAGLASRFPRGGRIAIWAPNIPEWIILEFAAALAGLTIVTVNPAYRPAELKYLLEQSKVSALFLVSAYRGNPMQETAARVSAELEAPVPTFLMESLADLMAAFRDRAPLPDVAPLSPAQIQYTSGTTGFPKGAVLSHRGLVNNARLCFEPLGLSAGDRYLNPMPLFHTGGCAIGTLGPLQAGACQILVNRFDPDLMLRLVETLGVTAMFGVPTMLVGMVEAARTRSYDLSSLRLVVSGGAMVAPDLVSAVQDLFGARVSIVYGQTETSPVLTQTSLTDSLEDATGTAGRPIDATEICIMSSAGGIAPIGQAGEICARGYCLMIGYNENPKATSQTIDADGWLHTGDVGVMDARGYLRVTGRIKEMIIRGGENLFPVEIENCLMSHPRVLNAAVVGAPDDRWGEIVVAFVHTQGGTDGDMAEELHRHCRDALSPQKTPNAWVFTDDLPLTASGKVQKFVLRDRYVQGGYGHVAG